ncbi:hypothetical protein DY000_02021297 [Brassica cretica]|uniref:Uncharacterized protein n=1 Tax=Brassica cretica TaxID=69181 RepID=A0ABQ7EBG2_BRACR|nr:hypothetical protein DY000_02021297 [Brassica cretica]
MHTATLHTEEYDEDYEEERAIEYRAILAEEDRPLHHSSWKRNATSIERTIPTSIETHLHQASCKRASTDIANYPSIDTGAARAREGDYSIRSWADDHYHESYAVETTVHDRGVDEPHEGFTYEELLNYQARAESDSLLAEACGKGTRFNPLSEADRRAAIDREKQQSIARASHISIDGRATTLIDIRPQPPSIVSKKATYDNKYLTSDEFAIFRDPDGYARAMDGHALQVSRDDIAEILQMANGAENLFIQQCNSPTHQQRVTNEFYDTAGGVDNRFKPKYRQHTRPSINVDVPTSINRRPEFGKRAYDRNGTRRFHWEEKDEYGVYRDDYGHARDVDGHIIRVSKDDIRSLLERASMEEHNYLCLLESARSFTQTKLVPKIYTKDEINEMFYRVCGAQEKNEGDFKMKLDGVYYPLNDSISWLTTCTEEMKQDIARIQTQCAAEATAPASIDRKISTSIDDNLTHSNPMKSQPNSYTRAEIDQLVEEIYRTLESAEERLDRRCDDIYFPMDLTMSSLTSQIEAIHRELIEIQRYIARRLEALASIDRRNNISIDSRRRTSIDGATTQGRLVPKMKSDMSDTNNHEE